MNHIVVVRTCGLAATRRPARSRVWPELVDGTRQARYRFACCRSNIRSPSSFVGHDGTAEMHRARRGGTLIQHLKEHQCTATSACRSRVLLHDVRLDDVELARDSFASGGHALPTTARPFIPRATCCSTSRPPPEQRCSESPRFLAAAAKAGVVLSARIRSPVRTIAQRAPLSPESFDFLSQHQTRRPSGLDSVGTISSALRARQPDRPVWRGEIQARGLGSIEVFDRMADRPATKGELVCTRPFPSMPLALERPDGSRYRATYFNRFPGAWHQETTPKRLPTTASLFTGARIPVLTLAASGSGQPDLPAGGTHRIGAECVAVGQQWQVENGWSCSCDYTCATFDNKLEHELPTSCAASLASARAGQIVQVADLLDPENKLAEPPSETCPWARGKKSRGARQS